MKLSTAFLLVVMLGGAVQAAPPQTAQEFLALPKARQEAEAPHLLKTPSANDDIWALGGVGIAGVRPLKFLAYEAIRHRRDAATVFTELLKASDSHTQLYALKGLSVCAPETFKRIAPAYLNRKETIREGQGCMVSTASFGEIVRRMQPPVVKVTPAATPTKASNTP